MYVAIAWGGTEILVFLTDALQGEQASGPVRKYLAILFIAGFPVAMYLAWTRDLGSTSAARCRSWCHGCRVGRRVDLADRESANDAR